jgi:Ras-related protein Rab-2A
MSTTNTPNTPTESSPEIIKAVVLPDDYNQYDLSFKMIVIGDAGVGKSCLTSQASKGIFEESYSATVGFEFLVFNVKLNEKVVKLQIWDTCGQELYRSLISSFYRNSSLAMMVYAINNKESFMHIESWLKEVKLQSNPDIKVFLIGNKSDLEEERKVTLEEAKTFKEEHGIHYFSEASAKNGINAKEVFIEAAKLLYLEHLKYKDSTFQKLGNDNKDVLIPVKVSKKKSNRKKGGCCG